MTQPAAPPSLAPVVHLPLHMELDGSLTNPAIEIDEVHSILYTRQPISTSGFGDWLSWHSPTIAAAAIVPTILVFAVLVLRVLRRPQTYGQYYCRCCNYDLTAPGGMPPDSAPTPSSEPPRCPECGIDISKRPARLGRSKLARLWLPALLCGAVLIACAITMAVTLEPYKAAFMSHPWLAALDSVSPLPRLQRRFNSEFKYHRITAFELPSGKVLDSFTLNLWGFNDAGITPDGRWMVALQGTPMSLESGQVVIRDLQARTQTELKLSQTYGRQYALSGFSDDGRFAYLGSFESDAQAAPTPTSTFNAVLRELDIANGTVRVVTSVAADYNHNARGVESPSQRFVVHARDGQVTWALYIDRGRTTAPGSPPVTTTNADVVVEGGKVYPIVLPGSSWLEPSLSKDGLTLDIPVYGSPTAVHVSLADGSTTQTPIQNGSAATAGNLTVSLLRSAANAPGTIQVLDAAGTLVATLDAGPGSSPWQPVLSKDGRWAASVAIHSGKSVLSGPTMSAEVVVWDLAPLQHPPTR